MNKEKIVNLFSQILAGKTLLRGLLDSYRYTGESIYLDILLSILRGEDCKLPYIDEIKMVSNTGIEKDAIIKYLDEIIDVEITRENIVNTFKIARRRFKILLYLLIFFIPIMVAISPVFNLLNYITIYGFTAIINYEEFIISSQRIFIIGYGLEMITIIYGLRIFNLEKGIKLILLSTLIYIIIYILAAQIILEVLLLTRP